MTSKLKKKILEALYHRGELNLNNLASIVDTTVGSIGATLPKLKKEGLVDNPNRGHYVITSKGREEAKKQMVSLLTVFNEKKSKLVEGVVEKEVKITFRDINFSFKTSEKDLVVIEELMNLKKKLE